MIDKSEETFIKKVATIVIAALLIGVIGQGFFLWRWQAEASLQITVLVEDVKDIKGLLQRQYQRPY